MTSVDKAHNADGCFGVCLVVDRPARLLLCLSGAATIAGWLGGLHWFLELSSHFIAWHALASALTLVLFLACRRWKWAAAALMLFLVQASVPLPWYWPVHQGATTEQGHCRILLANVLSSNSDTRHLLELIDETDPDVVCVQEVTRDWAEVLRGLEARYPVSLVVPRPDNFGIALYSRLSGPLPELRFQREHGVPAIETSFEANGRTVHLLTVHTLPPIGPRLAGRRDAQLASTRAWVEGQPGPAIVVGDLNLTMFSPVYRRWIAGTALRNVRAGHGVIGTWPAWVPGLRLPLDQCLVTEGIGVLGVRAGTAIGSDHLPLIIDLRIPGCSAATTVRNEA